MTYIDVHCHLDRLKEIDRIIAEAKKNNVGIIISNGVDSRSNNRNLELSEKYPEVKVAMGVYPLETLKMDEKMLDRIIGFIKDNKDKIIAIGEVGIDFKEVKSVEKQKKNFQKFVELSVELDKPIIVHSRKAEKEVIDILEEFKCKKVLLHCFSGRQSLIKRIVNNDWFVSIPASVKYNQQFKELVQLFPLSNLLCETDSPFLHPDKKQINAPANVIESYKAIAKIKKKDLKIIERAIERNYKRLFNK